MLQTRMFSRKPKKAVASKAKTSAVAKLDGPVGRQVTKADCISQLTVKALGAHVSTTIGDVVACDPGSCSEAWIAMVELDTMTGAAMLIMTVAATIAPKHVMSQKFLAMNLNAMPSTYVTSEGVNHKALAITGHTIILLLGAELAKIPAAKKMLAGYKASLGGVTTIRAFGAAGLIAGATGNKLVRQGLLRTYAGLSYEDVPRAKMERAFGLVKAMLTKLLSVQKTVWVLLDKKKVPVVIKTEVKDVAAISELSDLTSVAEYMALTEPERVEVDKAYAGYLEDVPWIQECLIGVEVKSEEVEMKDVLPAIIKGMPVYASLDGDFDPAQMHGEWMTMAEATFPGETREEKIEAFKALLDGKAKTTAANMCHFLAAQV